MWDLELLTMFTRNSRNRTRNSTNQIVHFFNLKNCNRNFIFAFLLSSAVGQVCLGLISLVYSLLRACLRIFLDFLFVCSLILGCCFFFHAFAVLPPFKIAKRVFHFFACLYVGIFRRVDIA
jgi:hypothetical protein